jgi:hypothetical protein
MGASAVNVSYEWFVVANAVFYVVYVVLLLLLLRYYIPQDPWIYFFFFQTTFTTLVIVVNHLAPEFVKTTERAPIFLVVKPLVLALTVVHLIGLGITTKHYSDKNVSFVWVFVLLCILQTALFGCIGLVRISIATPLKTTSANFNYEIPILTRLNQDMHSAWSRMEFEKSL